MIMDHEAAIRSFWNIDAATYDDAESHNPTAPAELAAWSAAFDRLLPPARENVLDVGAGTGFLSLKVAHRGYSVTALDLSPGMLAALKTKAAHYGLEVTLVEARAEDPPPGPFAVVMERHLLWTLPDPVGALAAWREVAPTGRLLLFESIWGRGRGPIARVTSKIRSALRRVRRVRPDHHGSYPEEVRAALPLGRGPSLRELLAAVEAAGWPAPKGLRLHELERAVSRRLPFYERLLGRPRWYAIVAGESSRPS